MNTESFLKQRLICVAVIDQPDDAVPLTEALLAGGLNTIEVTFRTAGAADAIARIRKALPNSFVGAGTLLTVLEASPSLQNHFPILRNHFLGLGNGPKRRKDHFRGWRMSRYG